MLGKALNGAGGTDALAVDNDRVCGRVCLCDELVLAMAPFVRTDLSPAPSLETVAVLVCGASDKSICLCDELFLALSVFVGNALSPVPSSATVAVLDFGRRLSDKWA